jgi:hypothetical protein
LLDSFAVRKYPHRRADENRNSSENGLRKWLKPAWILDIVVFLQDTPKLKTGYPQKYPHERSDFILPLWAVKDDKYFVFSGLLSRIGFYRML